MICYRDMTFCLLSKDCATAECPRHVTKDVEAGAEEMGLGLAMADCSSTCKTGFQPKEGA